MADKQPTPAEFRKTLAARGVTLHTDGHRVWPEPKASMREDEIRYAADYNDELVKLAEPPKEKPGAPVDQPQRTRAVRPGKGRGAARTKADVSAAVPDVRPADGSVEPAR